MRAVRGLPLPAVALIAALVPLLSGCGSQPAHPDVAALSARLDQVDQALSSRSFAEARTELAALTVETRDALSSGDLTSAKAATILNAIATLSATLPAPVRTTPLPPTTPTFNQDSQGDQSPKKHHDNGHHGNDNQGGGD